MNKSAISAAQSSRSLSFETLDSTGTGVSRKVLVVRIHALQILLLLFDTGSSEMHDVEYSVVLLSHLPVCAVTPTSFCGSSVVSSLG